MKTKNKILLLNDTKENSNCCQILKTKLKFGIQSLSFGMMSATLTFWTPSTLN